MVTVEVVENEPQRPLMSLQVLGELLEIQQTIMVDVALQDYLWVQRETVSHSAGTTDRYR